MTWLARHSAAIQALAAAVTAVVALAALVGVKLQLDAAEATQARQSAREAYRAHLTLSIGRPDLAAPRDACALADGPDGTAYDAFLDHLLYSAEQMLDTQPGWEATFAAALQPHARVLCRDPAAVQSGAPGLDALLAGFVARVCPGVDPCP